MFHLRASVALGRGKSPARAARIALIKLRRVRVARPWALGLDGSSHAAPPLTTAGSRTSHARPVCVRGHRGGRGGLLA